MRALVVYESVYGNTHRIADQIGSGLGPTFEVSVEQASRVTVAEIVAADLLVVGSPTHVHGLPSRRSREAAARGAGRPSANPALDPDATSVGVREWLRDLAPLGGKPAAAFDTRYGGPALLTGRAAKGIARLLRHRGGRLIVVPESFIVDKQNRLATSEAERAEAWGRALAAKAAGG